LQRAMSSEEAGEGGQPIPSGSAVSFVELIVISAGLYAKLGQRIWKRNGAMPRHFDHV
jgi:hypothetical protein